MRIRSIKPDFWSDEDLSKLSLETVLLAVGLQNYADDEGYFNANPQLIKSAIFPLRAIKKPVAVMLSELAAIKFVEIRHHGEKALGFLLRFASMQRVNRPVPSLLRAGFEGYGNKTGEVSEACVKPQGAPKNVEVMTQGVLSESSVSPPCGIGEEGKGGGDGLEKGEDQGGISDAPKPSDRDEVYAYAKAVFISKDSADRFFDHYSATGWLMGVPPVPVQSWQAALRKLARNEGWTGVEKIAEAPPTDPNYLTGGRAIMRRPKPKEPKLEEPKHE